MTTFEYLRQAQAVSPGVGTSGAGGSLGTAANAGPAHPDYQVGAVGFGPMWEEQPTLRELYDQAVGGLVRAECELSEANARIAVLEAEQIILKNKIDCLRDDLCRDKCRDKAAADGGWANI
jgi:hypothetical protein